MFKIRMGIPEMKEFWDDLLARKKSNSLTPDEEELLKRLSKTLKFLSADPKHPSLKTHEIEELSNKYKMKIWQSYLDPPGMGQTAERLQF